MVRLDPSLLRYMGREEFRVLTAIEMGMKNHDIVPQQIITSVAGLRGGAAHRALDDLGKYKMVWHAAVPYDGFRLTYAGYDYLALRALLKRGAVQAVGTRVGVGKESDIYIAQAPGGEHVAIKLHRLGRTSFRAVKNKRDYLRNRKHAGWLYMSRLAAEREAAFMKALYEHGFPVPRLHEYNRHAVVMDFIKGSLLANVTELGHPARVYNEIMELIVRLAESGLVHCDCNEFNLIVHEKDKQGRHVTLIDFPQMVSTRHINAAFYFDRDVECVRTFFTRRFAYTSERYPVFARDIVVDTGAGAGDAGGDAEAAQASGKLRLDVEVQASGYSVSEENKSAFEVLQEELRARAMEEHGDAPDSDGDMDSEDEDEDDEDGEDGEEGQAAESERLQSLESGLKSLTVETADSGDSSDSDDAEDKPDAAAATAAVAPSAAERHKISQEVQRKIGTKQKAPVRKLGNLQKGRRQRAIRESMTDTIF
eukprot:m51a1_g7669 putative serine threonine-protein kinase rio2 (480) ;mRNA; f:462821-464903